jgi:hypothetical protein
MDLSLIGRCWLVAAGNCAVGPPVRRYRSRWPLSCLGVKNAVSAQCERVAMGPHFYRARLRGVAVAIPQGCGADLREREAQIAVDKIIRAVLRRMDCGEMISISLLQCAI